MPGMSKKKVERDLILAGESSLVPIPAGDVSQLIDTFFRGKDPETIRAYQQRLGHFASYLGMKTLQEASQAFLGMKHKDALMAAIGFQDHLLRVKKYSPSYVAGHITALQSLVKLGRMLDLIAWELEMDRVAPEAYKNTMGPGTEAIGRAIELLSGKTDPISVRDRAIITLLYQCCLRRGDLISLDLEHVDFVGHGIWPKRKKRSERTFTELHKDGELVLKAWIVVRGEDPGPLFINFDPARKGDGRLSGMSIVRICHRYGLGKPHGLRHTGTTDALEATNGNIPEVMKRTGHKDPKTLMIYNDNRERTAGKTSEKISDLMKKKMADIHRNEKEPKK